VKLFGVAAAFAVTRDMLLTAQRFFKDAAIALIAIRRAGLAMYQR
jgi:hypothetical protein